MVARVPAVRSHCPNPAPPDRVHMLAARLLHYQQLNLLTTCLVCLQNPSHPCLPPKERSAAYHQSLETLAAHAHSVTLAAPAAGRSSPSPRLHSPSSSPPCPCPATMHLLLPPNPSHASTAAPANSSAAARRCPHGRNSECGTKKIEHGGSKNNDRIQQKQNMVEAKK